MNKIKKLPRRIKRSLGQWRDGSYRWERNAREGVSWIDPSRRLLLEKVKGTSSLRECQLLTWLATEAPSGGVIVEIGGFLGRSAAWLCEGAMRHQPSLPVYSIDPHERGTWESFQQTVETMELRQRGLQVIRSRSQEVGISWKLPISMIWIDGCHEYEAVCDDIRFFIPHVIPGGWIVFDDAAGGAFPGCERAIAECMPAFHAIHHRFTLRHLQLFQVDEVSA